MGRQIFEADGQILGERQIPNFGRSELFGGMKAQDSFCYFCPKCGEIWGRLRHEGAGYWQCVYRNCRKHGGGVLSMQYPADTPTGVGRDWPREALLRELMVLIEETERLYRDG
jgi:hypothetical protein